MSSLHESSKSLHASPPTSPNPSLHPPPHPLSARALIRLLTNPAGYYLLFLSALLGFQIWQTFVGGIVAFKSLPRSAFARLQASTFPLYFAINVFLASALLGRWTFVRPAGAVWDAGLRTADSVQAAALALVAALHLLNLVWVTPVTTQVMYERHKVEREEGKQYFEPGISDTLKALNKRFAILHGLSSFLNLIALLLTVFHALFLAHLGLTGV